MQAFHRMETISDFAQISGKDSLCEIENALLANHKRLYYLGMEAVAKSTLSEAMNRRNPEIFKALFEEILDRVMAVAPKHKFKFKNPLYAILQPLDPQSSLNKFNMVGFASNCENISVLSLLCNREKFSAQPKGLFLRNNCKMPRKKM